MVPYDPLTKSSTTWKLVFEEPDPLTEPAETDLPEGGEPGIIDVRSGSPLIALDGTPYVELVALPVSPARRSRRRAATAWSWW